MIWGAGRHSGDLDIQCAQDLLIGFVSRLIPVETENTIFVPRTWPNRY